MTGHTEITPSSRERFMKMVRDEIARFEREEAEIRQSERRERAAKLRLSLDTTGAKADS